MPIVVLVGHDYIHAVCDILRMYYVEVYITDNNIVAGIPDVMIINTADNDSISTKWGENEISRRIDGPVTESGIKREVKRQLYQAMVSITGIEFPWGSLTGIRPTLIASECIDNPRKLRDFYFVSENKAVLAVETAFHEGKIREIISPEFIHCYIGIPFCRTRCEYCSFISEEYIANEKLVSLYIDALIKEIARCLPAVENRIQTIYIGGGTPTSIPDLLFEKLLKELHRYCISGNLLEYTVEAGRADSITPEKLEIMKKYGVGRICINPQTFNDSTLRKIGRSHTADQAKEAFRLAGTMGFRTVNMDLIAGLPGETFDDFKKSLDELICLNPENITIHSLSLKHSSSMTREISENNSTDFHLQCFHMPNKEISDMIEYSYSELKKHGYHPYYLYRQKNAAGGHENTGYSKSGRECLYNVAMMGDMNTIMAFGAGAISKRFFPDELDKKKRMVRSPNMKNIREYLERIDELIIRKKIFFGGN